MFGVDQASKAKSATGPKIAELSRSSFFSSKEASTYQRLLRLSPTTSETTHQLGAAATGATGLSKGGDIAVFDVSTTGSLGPKLRGKLELSKEAMDLDITQVGDDAWQLVYCDDYELHVMDIGKKTCHDPSPVYEMTQDEAIGSKIRPSFRSVRYLTSHSVMTVSNLPRAGGAILHGFRLPANSDQAKARLAASVVLPKNVTRATGLAVRNLSPPSTPSAPQGNTQFAIAVAGQDYSVSLYTMDYQTLGDIGLMANLHPITTLKAVHPSPISGLAFSHFTPPKSGPSRAAPTLKLASIGSMGNTVVVHALPLRRLPDKSASARRGGPPRPQRYVVALKSHGPSPAALLIVTAVVVCLLATLLQGVLEVRGLSGSVVGARRVVPATWQSPMRGGGVAAGAQGGASEFLAGLSARRGLANAVVLSAEGAEVKVDAHDAERYGDAREWGDLPASQKAAWKERLEQAGHWGEEMGEAVFRGVLFADLAGAVGHMVGG